MVYRHPLAKAPRGLHPSLLRAKAQTHVNQLQDLIDSKLEKPLGRCFCFFALHELCDFCGDDTLRTIIFI